MLRAIPATKPRAARVQWEELEQEALYRWRDLSAAQYPGLDLMFAIPNGAYLHGSAKQRAMQWSKLKRQGARSGVSDNFLPVRHQGLSGLWIELKAARPHAAPVSAEQREWLDCMRAQGYAAHVAYGWQHAVEIINSYYGRL